MNISKLIALASLTALIMTENAEAQTFKVLKIQGKKAIVEVADPSSVSLNQSYTVGNSASSSSSINTANSSQRKYGIAGQLEFSSLKADTAGAKATDTFFLSGTFLWNLKQFEAGPYLGYRNTNTGGSSDSTTMIGGTGYYNFQENKPGIDQIFSAVGTFAMTSVSPSAGSSYTGLLMEAGGSYRWFLLSTDHCLNFSAVYSMLKYKPANTDVTVSGFKILGGISTYF